MKSDMHIHTRFSIDGKSSMEDYCIEALKRGIDRICFTEHVDFNKFEYSRWQYDAKAYFKELERVRKMYPSLDILAGMEFSEPHLFHKEFSELSKYPYDNVIASIHHCKNGIFPGPINLPAEQAVQEYYELMLKTLEYGKFQTLAHLDFPRRYFDAWVCEDATLEEIFSLLREQNISLEVNTSSVFNSGDEPLPNYKIIDRYLNAGGGQLVLGSDAHTKENLGKSFDEVLAHLPQGKVGYIKERQYHIEESDDESAL